MKSVPRIVVVLLLAVATHAHNWMSSPSRANNNFNAYMQAPCPPRGPRVHYQVTAGQLFPFEYASGHSTPARGGVYVTVLKAKDEAKMKEHSRALLDEYLQKGKTASPNYMAAHKAMHIGSSGGRSLTPQTNVRASLTKHVEGLVKSAAGNAPMTHVRDYTKWAFKPAATAAIWAKNADATKDDIRVAYQNDKYPWIVAAHKFKLHEDKTEESDLVMMEIPPGSEPGLYIVQYIWNGYYDCTDVLVVAEQSPDLMGRPGTGGITYNREDNCMWKPTPFLDNWAVLPVDNPECRVFTSANTNGFEACKDDCAGRNACVGVQVVPYTMPAAVKAQNLGGLFGTGAGKKPYPDACGALQGKEGDLVCFSVREGNTDHRVGGSKFTSNDPLDSVFHSTCYTKGTAWAFTGTASTTEDVPPEKIFKYGSECLDCANMELNTLKSVVPFWNVTFGKCQHCDYSLG